MAVRICSNCAAGGERDIPVWGICTFLMGEENRGSPEAMGPGKGLGRGSYRETRGNGNGKRESRPSDRELRRHWPAAEEESRLAGHLPRPGHGSRGSRGVEPGRPDPQLRLLLRRRFALDAPRRSRSTRRPATSTSSNTATGASPATTANAAGRKRSNRTTSRPPATTSSAASNSAPNRSNAQVAIDNSGTSTEGSFYVNSPARNGGFGGTCELRRRRQLRNRTDAELSRRRAHLRLRRDHRCRRERLRRRALLRDPEIQRTTIPVTDADYEPGWEGEGPGLRHRPSSTGAQVHRPGTRTGR